MLFAARRQLHQMNGRLLRCWERSIRLLHAVLRQEALRGASYEASVASIAVSQSQRYWKGNLHGTKSQQGQIGSAPAPSAEKKPHTCSS